MRDATLSFCLEDGEEVSASYSAARQLRDYGPSPLDVPASIRLSIGHVDLWGEPQVVLRVLCDALTAAREAEASGSEELIIDLGGMA